MSPALLEPRPGCCTARGLSGDHSVGNVAFVGRSTKGIVTQRLSTLCEYPPSAYRSSAALRHDVKTRRITQAQRLTLSSRAFHSSPLGPYTEKVTSLLGFDMLLPMNTGVEAVETAIKLSRKWAYEVKGVPEGKAIVLSAENNFHGRTIGVISMSTDPESRKGFGPFLKGVGPICPFEPKEGEEQRRIRYNNIGDLERVLEKHGKEVAAFLVEPIQGEAG